MNHAGALLSLDTRVHDFAACYPGPFPFTPPHFTPPPSDSHLPTFISGTLLSLDTRVHHFAARYSGHTTGE